MRRIIITGGIGSGKSMVSRMLRVMGYPVYDCDSQAMRLIHENEQLRCEIVALLGAQAYDVQGHYNRQWVSDKVFANPVLLQKLNDCVHPAVARDIERWIQGYSTDCVFVETALLRQSGLIIMADDVWRVTAPEQLRIKRVQHRSDLTEQQVRKRILAQQQREAPYPDERIIVNDECLPLLPQILQLI